METAALEPGEVVVVYGQGPVGLLMMQAAECAGAKVIGLDFLESRLEIARELGAHLALQSRNATMSAPQSPASQTAGEQTWR